jgi:hypothetical protein
MCGRKTASLDRLFNPCLFLVVCSSTGWRGWHFACEQKELDQLESEREQLRTKLSKLQNRVKSETDASAFQEILAATSALRKGTASEHRNHMLFGGVCVLLLLELIAALPASHVNLCGETQSKRRSIR